MANPRNKFGVASKENRTWEGLLFDSKREMDIYREYRALIPRGGLVAIERQIRIPLEVNGVKVCTYFADFRLTWDSGSVELVEVKGFETAVWKLKYKLLMAVYPELKLRIVR
jgi:Protein of unknown function (DUF1064)